MKGWTKPMEDNIFTMGKKSLTLDDYLCYDSESRGNLGEQLPVTVYRMLEYSLREELVERFDKQTQIEVFRGALRRRPFPRLSLL